jgi:Na+-driven multidrug efflux pump
MIEWSVAVGVVLGVAFLVLRDVLPHLFTTDPDVVELAALVLVFVGVMQPLNGYVFALDGILIGAGDLRYLAGAMSVAAMVFIALALTVRLTGGRLGWLWTALVALTALRALGLFLRYRTDRWLDVGREP